MNTLRPFISLTALALAACGTTTPTRELSQGYAIFDVKAGPEIGGGRIAEAVKTALQRNMSAVQLTNGIPPSPLPDKMPRFQLVSPFKAGTGIAAIAASQGQSIQVPVCDGAILTANARDTSMRRYGEGSSFFVCVMPYQGGYALDVYTTFSRASGAFSTEVLAATLMRPMVGDSSQFIAHTIQDVVESLTQTGATVRMLESFP